MSTDRQPSYIPFFSALVVVERGLTLARAYLLILHHPHVGNILPFVRSTRVLQEMSYHNRLPEMPNTFRWQPRIHPSLVHLFSRVSMVRNLPQIVHCIHLFVECRRIREIYAKKTLFAINRTHLASQAALTRWTASSKGTTDFPAT